MSARRIACGSAVLAPCHSTHIRLRLYSRNGAIYSVARMSSHKIQVRRATLEDLPKLIALWQKEFLPWEVLEKRFTEFQIGDHIECYKVESVARTLATAEGGAEA